MCISVSYYHTIIMCAFRTLSSLSFLFYRAGFTLQCVCILKIFAISSTITTSFLVVYTGWFVGWLIFSLCSCLCCRRCFFLVRCGKTFREVRLCLFKLCFFASVSFSHTFQYSCCSLLFCYLISSLRNKIATKLQKRVYALQCLPTKIS